MNSSIESLKYIKYNNKPSIGRIQQYLDNRLQFTQKIGLTVSNDFLGNTVITSSEHEEQTLAGTVPATFIASPEGKHIIANNPGILSQIHNGTIPHLNHIWHGLESKVYKIVLQTDAGQKDYALKYTFPIHEMHGIYTSGIVAMRLMQLAERERPIPDIHYTVPIFATHDLTVAPFVFDGISIYKFMLCLEFPDRDDYLSELLNANDLTSKQKFIIREMRQREHTARQENQVTFFNQMDTALERERGNLKDWVNKQCRLYPEFTQHRYNTMDTFLRESVVNLEAIHELGRVNYENSAFNSFNPGFVTSLLDTLSLVELGVGMAEY
jgi:hypothetical protein